MFMRLPCLTRTIQSCMACSLYRTSNVGVLILVPYLPIPKKPAAENQTSVPAATPC